MNTHAADLRRYAALARAQGWTVERTQGGHMRFVPADPNMPIYVTGTTPGDHRRHHKIRSDLKRRGLRLDDAGEKT